MKKLVIVMIAFVAMVVNGFGQNFNVSGDVQFSSKNISLGTGIVFEESTAFITHLNGNMQFKKVGVSVCYSGYSSITGSHTTYNLVDIIGSYEVSDNFTLMAGYEATYTDYTDQDDKNGSGIFAMATWNKGRFSTTGIVFTNPQISFLYLIQSATYQISDHVSAYGLFGYTNAEAYPVYGLAGLKVKKGAISFGAYGVARYDAPGAVFNIECSF